MKLEVIGLADAMVSGVQAQALDKVVVEKVNDVTEKVIIIQKEVDTKIEEVQQTIEKIEKGHIDWIDTNE
jgi:D-mannonate dehydratase